MPTLASIHVAKATRLPMRAVERATVETGRGIVGDRMYGIPGGPMLLHASRLVVPRVGKPAIDVTAPLPEYFAEWRDAA